MREFIGQCDVSNTVMMLRSAFKGTIVVVEGNTDSRLYGKFLKKNATRIVVAQCRKNVISSVREVTERRRDRSVVGIVDSDLDIINRRKQSPPTFATDTRDSESLMFRSRAFDGVMCEYSDPELVSRFEERYGDIRAAVMRACYPVGILMYISEREGYGLSFKNIDFGTFIDRNTLRCNVRRMCEEIISMSSKDYLSASKLADMVSSEQKRDVWEVCRGHDITEVMAIGLRGIFGSYNAKHITGNEVAGALRLSFGMSDMVSTELYESSKSWTESNGLALWVTERSSPSPCLPRFS